MLRGDVHGHWCSSVTTVECVLFLDMDLYWYSCSNFSPVSYTPSSRWGVHEKRTDFEHMVSLLPRDEEAMSSVSIHAHSHATVYSLPNSAVLRNLAEHFPGVVAQMAVFARRQQHARIRLQWQDMGSRFLFRVARSHCLPVRFGIMRACISFASPDQKTLASIRNSNLVFVAAPWLAIWAGENTIHACVCFLV